MDTWVREGLTTEDIGNMADIHEFVSMDFLRAVQLCVIFLSSDLVKIVQHKRWSPFLFALSRLQNISSVMRGAILT